MIGQLVGSFEVNTLSTELSIVYVTPSNYHGVTEYVGDTDVTVRPPSDEHLSFIVTV